MRKCFNTAFLFLCLALALTSACHAQAIDLQADREAITSVARNWRFHPGDDAQWASPSFDDRTWSRIEPTKDWAAQGMAPQNGFAWFRFRLRVPPHTSTLVLEWPHFTQSYQLFADGKRVAEVGGLPPTPRTVDSGAHVYTLNLTPANKARDLTFALRLWESPQFTALAMHRLTGPAFIGAPAVVLGGFARSKAAALLRRGSDYTEALIAVPIGAATLLLFFLTRQSYYLWFVLSLMPGIFSFPVHLAAVHWEWNLAFAIGFDIALDLLSSIAIAAFLLGTMHRGSWDTLRIPIALACLSELGPILLLTWSLPFIWADGIYFVFNTAFELLLFWHLIRAWRTGVIDAKLFLIPYALSAVISGMGNLGHWLIDFGYDGFARFLPDSIELLRQPFRVSLNDVANVLALFGFLAVLVYRFARTVREEQRLTTALHAAQQVQHRLIPVNIPVLGGLRTEIAYLAAEEVGGDFCQILPRSDGSVLIAIGDVSGKGLQAAMLGTLAVGALRSFADEFAEPATILERLNQMLVRIDDAGFITCLCLSISPSGQIVFANAGHLAPYLDGKEMDSDHGLPLGIVPGVSYPQTAFQLPANARLTLLSDGVVEARSSTGELFGFDRASRLSHLPASSIAAAAHQYGQQDDITVITLDWTGSLSIPALA